ncbi:MAG: hypothetical protein AAF004_14345, partial [Pseudomonadota bacterium]
MFSSESTDNLAFIARQLSGMTPNMSIEDGLDQLSRETPDTYAADVTYLKGLLNGSDTLGPKLGTNPYAALSRLMPSANAARDTLFKEFVAYVQQSKIIFETYWAGVIGLMWYLAAVSTVAL